MSNQHLLSQSLAGADNPGLGTANTQMGQGAPVATPGFNSFNSFNHCRHCRLWQKGRVFRLSFSHSHNSHSSHNSEIIDNFDTFTLFTLFTLFTCQELPHIPGLGQAIQTGDILEAERFNTCHRSIGAKCKGSAFLTALIQC